MNFGELIGLSCTFAEFIDQDQDINREKTLEIYKGIEVDEDLLNKIKSINRPVHILAFAEIWCPDCIINVPAVQKISDINPQINVYILPREGYEEHLSNYKLAGKVKIPTFIVLDENFEELGAFIETPTLLRNLVAKGNQVEIIVAKRKYRKGEYIKDTIKEITNIILRK
ncbi:thioredoxin family protein [Alkaliphilus transvaalensis]|uniref:thioredoxin family protein n=1 Tax=Alkaliphilus transvaalensis TaxID=114628 RepID=UPI00047CF0F3|nr:thioredoxin family protein [Alkaliphilus transvaalensis]